MKEDTILLPFPDTVLQAYAQLAACRLDAQRAMIVLIDKDTAYIIAEATKTLDLENSNQFEVVGDSLRYGTTCIPKNGGLVEWTLRQEPNIESGREISAHYEVCDISAVPPWKNNEFVAPEPCFRHYCGVPLRTETDINIGLLYLLDTSPRESASRHDPKASAKALQTSFKQQYS